MKNNLLNLLGLNQPYAEHERLLKHKVVYLNSIYLLVAPVALLMGIYRWQLNPIMGMLDFILSGAAIVLLNYLKRHRDKVELISTISISITFCVFYGFYLFAPDQTTRLSPFFLVLAAAFLLKGLRTGIIWLLFIIFMIAIVQFIPAIKTEYSNFDIIASCVYLVALLLIFWNYETLKEEQYQREKEHNLQSLIDERWRLALESTGDAIWDWHIQTDHLNFSKSYAEMLGYSTTEVGTNTEHFKNSLHPQDKPAAIAYLRKYLAGEIEGQHTFEQRLRCKDGSYKWILCRGSVIERDTLGRPQRMVGTHIDVTERKRIENDLKLTQQKLRGLSKIANEALESERKRAARDLHDELGQLLVASKMYLGTLRAALPANDKKLDALGEDILTMLNMTITATRRIASDLRPPILDDVGLAAALEWLIDSFSKQSEIIFKLNIDGNTVPILDTTASALYRITQESLTNVVKHAQATSVGIRLIQNAQLIELTISDNGRGIEVSDQNKQGSFGLLGIRERVILLGGEFSIDGKPGLGTKISVKIPIINSSLNTFTG